MCPSRLKEPIQPGSWWWSPSYWSWFLSYSVVGLTMYCRLGFAGMCIVVTMCQADVLATLTTLHQTTGLFPTPLGATLVLGVVGLWLFRFFLII